MQNQASELIETLPEGSLRFGLRVSPLLIRTLTSIAAIATNVLNLAVCFYAFVFLLVATSVIPAIGWSVEYLCAPLTACLIGILSTRINRSYIESSHKLIGSDASPDHDLIQMRFLTVVGFFCSTMFTLSILTPALSWPFATVLLLSSWIGILGVRNCLNKTLSLAGNSSSALPAVPKFADDLEVMLVSLCKADSSQMANALARECLNSLKRKVSGDTPGDEVHTLVNELMKRRRHEDADMISAHYLKLLEEEES